MKGLFFNIIGNPGRIRSVTDLTPNFRLIELEAESFRSAQFAPGQKLMVRVDRLSARTYTPFRWDTAKGIASILAYLHGPAPGTTWARSVKAGDPIQFLGPKHSLSLNDLQSRAIFFGDETSIALAAALQENSPDCMNIRFNFEVSSPAECRQVLDPLQINDATIIPRESDDAHFAKCDIALTQMIEQTHPSHLVLTGKAQTIRRLRSIAISLGVNASRIKIRPYWSPGKVGMD